MRSALDVGLWATLTVTTFLIYFHCEHHSPNSSHHSNFWTLSYILPNFCYKKYQIIFSWIANIWPLVSHDKNQNLIKFQLLLNSYFKWMSGFWCNQLQFWHHNLINIKLLMQCNWCTFIPCKWNLTFFNKQLCNKIYKGRKVVFLSFSNLLMLL